MKDKIISGIAEKTGIPHLTELLAERLSGSELNSLLLEVFSKHLEGLSPALLLKLYQVNRFVHPADTDMIGLLKLELRTLELLRDHSFQAIELSPAAQLGSCSVVAPADQKKIISAARNTEIVADATNALALHIADLKRSGKASSRAKEGSSRPKEEQSRAKEEPLRFCTIHRHIRTQEFSGKGFTAHFKVGCLVSSGRDTGNYQFECTSLQEHILTLEHLLREVFGIKKIRHKLQRRDGYDSRNPLLEKVAGHLERNIKGLELLREDLPETNNYYKGIQLKTIIEINDREIEIADGGFVDWTQLFLGNKKERLLISGFGLDLLYKFQSGLI